MSLPLAPISVPPALVAMIPHVAAFTLGECRCLRGLENGRLHLSISHKSRAPTWDEISEARERLLPFDKWFVMVFPPPQHYVNIHRFCFHLWESRDVEGHDLWSEGAGQARSKVGPL